MNKEQHELLDEAYENYSNKLLFNEKDCHIDYSINQPNKTFIPYSQEEFINKCKTDTGFSKKWELKIEERELSDEMRYTIWFNNNYETGMEKYFDPNKLPDFDNEYYEPTPTKLITITYNDKTIESYDSPRN
jgi:hypothetical protein